MSLVIDELKVPLRVDADGSVRVGNTRVTLDTVVSAIESGVTPEQLVQDYDVLRLADAYAVYAYYLQHRSAVAAYLAERNALGEENRTRIEATEPSQSFRETLITRRAQKEG